MINTSALRSKILVSAMHGQLSERLSSDSVVDALYEDIIELKNGLIKSKAIREDAKLEEIIEPEYELPSEWKWVRFGKIITLQSGQDLKSNEYNASNDGIPYMTGASNFNDDGTLTINRWTETPKSIAKCGDILISVKGTVGKVAVVFEEEVHIARQIMGIRTYKLNVDFVKYFLESEIERIKAASKGLIPGIERNDILNMSFPLPPIEEQKRISDRITEAFHILETIDELQSAYSSDLEVLKSKIIDAGIQGKLTEQLLEDGNAEDLYAAIQEEKEKLIKEKKIKKAKALPEITEDEIPFEIPDNWKWVRVGDVINEVIVPQRDKPSFSGDIPWCRIEDRDGIYLNGSKSNQYVSQETIDKMNLRVCPVGTVLAACSGASIGTVIINTVECCTNQTFNGLVCSKGLYNWYLFVYLKSKIEVMKRMGSGSAMAYISQEKFRNMIIPLPPYNEQIRIIEFIDKLIHFR